MTTWKSNAMETYADICLQSNVSAFQYTVWICLFAYPASFLVILLLLLSTVVGSGATWSSCANHAFGNHCVFASSVRPIQMLLPLISQSRAVLSGLSCILSVLGISPVCPVTYCTFHSPWWVPHHVSLVYHSCVYHLQFDKSFKMVWLPTLYSYGLVI